MGLKYAARAGRRGRARWAERAEPAHGRGLRGWGHYTCRGVYGGLRPLAPPIAHLVPRAKRSNARSAMRKAIRRRDEHLRHAGSPKSQPPPTTRTKAVFSLESEGFLFDKTKRNLSVLGRRQLDHWPRRALTSSKRLSIRRWASSLRAPKLSPRARVASSG